MIRIDKRVRSLEEISKNFLGNLKIEFPFKMTNAKSSNIEISMKDILTLPHDAVFGHLRNPVKK